MIINFARAEEVDSIVLSRGILKYLHIESLKGNEQKELNAGERVVFLWGYPVARVLLISHCIPQNELEASGVIEVEPNPPLSWGFKINPQEIWTLESPSSPSIKLRYALFAHRHPLGSSDPSSEDLNATTHFGIGLLWWSFWVKEIDDFERTLYLRAYYRKNGNGETINIPVGWL